MFFITRNMTWWNMYSVLSWWCNNMLFKDYNYECFFYLPETWPDETCIVYCHGDVITCYLKTITMNVFFIYQKHDLMKHVSHQCIVMQFILELARSLKTDPRSCVRAFFSRYKHFLSFFSRYKHFLSFFSRYLTLSLFLLKVSNTFYLSSQGI